MFRSDIGIILMANQIPLTLSAQAKVIHIGMVELPPLAEHIHSGFGFAEEVFREIKP